LSQSKPSYWQRTSKDFWKKFFYLLAIVWLSKAGYILGFTYSGILLGTLLAIAGGALGILLVNLISVKLFKYKSNNLFLRIDLTNENKNNQTHLSIQRNKLNFILFVGILCLINIAGSSVFLSNNNKNEQSVAKEISLVNKRDYLNYHKKIKQSDNHAQPSINLPSNNFQKDVMQVLSKEFNDEVIKTLKDKHYDTAVSYTKVLDGLFKNNQIPSQKLNEEITNALIDSKRPVLAFHYIDGIIFLQKKYELEPLINKNNNAPSSNIKLP